MKTLFFIPFLLTIAISFSQEKSIAEEVVLSRIYNQRNNSKSIINYDKSFVSEDRLFYESLDKPDVNLPLSDKHLIEITLKNYIEGSSFNKMNTLKSSFYKDATLYLTVKEGFKRLTTEEYSGFFPSDKKGEFNGRVGNIISIDIKYDGIPFSSAIFISYAIFRIFGILNCHLFPKKGLIIPFPLQDVLTSPPEYQFQ